MISAFSKVMLKATELKLSKWLFTDLAAGDYCVQFGSIPAGWSISPANQGDGTNDSKANGGAQIPNIYLTADDPNEDMGIYVTGSLGDSVVCVSTTTLAGSGTATVCGSASSGSVLRLPSTLRMTSMLGRDRAGPASSRARDGPGPMPAPMSPCSIGTSVSVAKYMKAPATAANKVAKRPLPPSATATQ